MGICPRDARSIRASDPIKNLRGCYCLLRRVGIQGPGDRAPALLDNFLSESLRLGFRLSKIIRAAASSLTWIKQRYSDRAARSYLSILAEHLAASGRSADDLVSHKHAVSARSSLPGGKIDEFLNLS